MAKGVYGFLKEQLHRLLAVDHRKMSRLPGSAFLILKLLIYAVMKFYSDRGFQRAGTLAYSMILALVPMLAIALLVVSTLGGPESIQPFMQKIVQAFTPSQSSEVASQSAVEWASSLALSITKPVERNKTMFVVFGFIAIVLTVLNFFTTIEGSLNDIWRAKRSRNVLSRFKNFWLIMTLGPIFLFLSYYASGRFMSIEIITFLMPFLFATIAFFLLYTLMPYTPVRIGPAAVGALFSGILWIIMKNWFNSYAAESARALTMKNAFGSLWLIPIFLIWLYFTWTVILIGAEIAFSSQNFDFIDSGYVRRSAEEGFSKEYLGVGLLVSVSEAFEKGLPPPKFNAIAKSLGVPEYVLFDVSGDLERAGLIESTSHGPLFFRPSRPAEKVTLADVASAVRGEGLAVPAGADTSLARGIRGVFSGAREAIDSHMESHNIKEFLSKSEKENILKPDGKGDCDGPGTDGTA